MLIGICGLEFSGRNEVAKYLGHQGFTRLYIREEQPAQANGCANGTHLVSEDAVTVATSSEDAASCWKALESISPTSCGHEMEGSIKFASATELLEYVTKRWKNHYVTTDVHTVGTLDTLSQRPFFLLLSVQAPTSVRYERYKTGLQTDKVPVSFEDFARTSDYAMYSGLNALSSLIYRSKLQILNASQTLELLYLRLSNLNLVDESRIRPSWDAYFMELAHLAARRSNCMKRRVGCVLVRGKRVIATGYNGTPRGVTNCNEGGCQRCNDGDTAGADLATCLCLHAEENALMESGRERIGDESVLYCNTCPCLTCSIKIVQMGLNEVIYSRTYSMDEKSFKVLGEGGVKVRQYWPPEEGVVAV
ncbi:cytidine deaminase-like protein [Limtongia smithiae]|uniref:cytidine deaminase-like protein n=1 Tax=Limtongia smithiae TaxID=1125753 RepID=UPI0034CD83DF